MLRMLTLLGAVGAAWALSQYLPSNDLSTDSRQTADIVTRTIAVPGGKSSDQRSVALLDLAVAALPAARSETVDADYQPAVSAGTPAVEAFPAKSKSDLPTADATERRLETDASAGPAADPKLTRLIQRELRRVGCLKSSADGVWGPGTERAMRRFAERLETDLPVDGPDTVLLILLEKFEDRACGRPCAAGEAPNASGRCGSIQAMARTRKPADKTDIAALSAEQGPGPDASAASAPEAKAVSRNVKVRTMIARASSSKRVRVARVAQQRRKTRWALPQYYGLGVTEVGPARVVPKKNRRRGAAAYRRWLRKSDITMR